MEQTGSILLFWTDRSERIQNRLLREKGSQKLYQDDIVGTCYV